MRIKPYLQSLGCAVLLLASCTDDALDNGANNGQNPEANSNVVNLTVLDGASQQGRIHTPAAPNTRALKSQRLQYVATIKNLEWQNEDHVWSATSVYLDDENKKAYVTWHSDRQATNPAQTWGGALDIVDISNEDQPKSEVMVGNGNLLKFNNVMKYNGKLYLSAMHPRQGGVVARINPGAPATADLIGFPGSSVNAVAEYSPNTLIAVSGFKGTYGTFDAGANAQLYDYENPENNAYLKLFTESGEAEKDFGGKYVAVDENGKAYVLRQNGDKGQIINVEDGKTINMTVPLLSENKYAEDYDPETEDWITEGTRQSVYFGKHMMVIRNGIAYVAAGKSGIYKYNLTDGKETKINGIFATGLYADDEFLYAATGSGLRIYQFNDETGELPLYAFEVETYDEEGTGAPTSTTAATTGASTTKRHSPNFVTAHHNGNNTYIYIAYGQSGVRVYKFMKEGEEQPGESEDNHGWVDPGDDSDIVWATENVEGYYAWGEIFHADSGENTWEEFEADKYGLSFTSPDGIVVTNDESYWTEGNGSKQKTAYTYDNYCYFDGSTAELSKYRLDDSENSEDDKWTLDPEEDVATMRWGNGWRMPTQDEWDEMVMSFANTIEENERGVTFTFNNGNTLFLPKTGYYSYDGGDWKDANGYYYWSSSLSTQINTNDFDYRGHTGGWIWNQAGDNKLAWSYESLAWMPDFSMLYYEYYARNGYDRANGYKVRPVKDKKNIPDLAK